MIAISLRNAFELSEAFGFVRLQSSNLLTVWIAERLWIRLCVCGTRTNHEGREADEHAADARRHQPYRSSRAIRLDVSQRRPPIFCTSE